MPQRDKDAIILQGGFAPNIVPGKSKVWLDLRANDSQYIKQLVEKAKNIAEGAAKMTGCTVQWSVLRTKLESMKRWPELEELCCRHSLEHLLKVSTPDKGWANLPTSVLSAPTPVGKPNIL